MEAREAERLANRLPVPAGSSEHGEHTKKHSASLLANGEK